MAKVWTHKDLDVWQGSLSLAETVYRVTRSFPVEERYGLVSQMRRAAVSVVSNIAEGAARRTRPDFLNFLHIARGSLAELEAQLCLAMRLGFVGDNDELLSGVERVGQMLNGLIARMRMKSSQTGH